MSYRCKFTNIKHLKELLFIAFKEVQRVEEEYNKDACSQEFINDSIYGKNGILCYAAFRGGNCLGKMYGVWQFNQYDIKEIYDACRKAKLIDFPLEYLYDPEFVDFDEEELQKEYKVWLKKSEIQKLKNMKSQLKSLFTEQELKNLLLTLIDEIDEDATVDSLISDITAYCKTNEKFKQKTLAILDEKLKNLPENTLKQPVQELHNILTAELQILETKLTDSSALENEKFDLLDKLDLLTRLFPNTAEKIDEIRRKIN